MEDTIRFRVLGFSPAQAADDTRLISAFSGAPGRDFSRHPVSSFGESSFALGDVWSMSPLAREGFERTALGVRQIFDAASGTTRLHLALIARCSSENSADDAHCGTSAGWRRMAFSEIDLTEVAGSLPFSVRLESVTAGDYDHDGFTDYLVRLSNGAAYVFQRENK